MNDKEWRTKSGQNINTSLFEQLKTFTSSEVFGIRATVKSSPVFGYVRMSVRESTNLKQAFYLVHMLRTVYQRTWGFFSVCLSRRTCKIWAQMSPCLYLPYVRLFAVLKAQQSLSGQRVNGEGL